MCEHLQETTSRYDPAKKVLTFVLVCRTCGTEEVLQTLDYEPKPIALSDELTLSGNVNTAVTGR